MDHYVAYHSVDLMGHDYNPDDNFNYHSRKAPQFLRRSIGALVWFIVGQRESRRTRYRLAGLYTPTKVTEDAEGCVVEGWGTPLRPPPELTALPWFSDLLHQQSNFSLGFNQLRDLVVLDALNRLVPAGDMGRAGSFGDADTDTTDTFDPSSITDARTRLNASIVQRRGQAAFRSALLHAYGATCTVSGCAVESVLDAAHIVPYRGTETNCVQNGLLLRTDLHTLFDLGLVAVDPDTMTVLVSPTLAESEYTQFAGRRLNAPCRSADAPSVAALEHHRVRAGLTPQ
jgi:hypothetical protein